MVFSDKDKILIKRLYLKGYTAKRLTDKFPEKSWTKRGVNKLLKKLRDTSTVDRRPGAALEICGCGGSEVRGSGDGKSPSGVQGRESGESPRS